MASQGTRAAVSLRKALRGGEQILPRVSRACWVSHPRSTPCMLQAPIARSYTSYTSNRGSDSIRAASLRRRASLLQRSLENDPGSAQRLTELLKVLNHFDPHQAMRVFEQQEPRLAFANNDAVKEYIRALVLANRLDYVDLDLLLGRNWREVAQGVATASRTAAVGAAVEGVSATGAATAPIGQVELKMPSSEPLKVQMAEPHRRNFWRLLRSSVTMLIMVAGMSVFAEGLAGNVQQKGFGMGSKKVTPVEDVNTTFADVKGCDEVKDELKEIILYLKDPDRFTRLGAKLPKGVMMSGAPGTGKTLLARAIAGEAGVPFLQASGSEFEEMFVGVGARRIRDLFQEARKHAPCIVFIDEIDAVGSKRSNRDNNAVRMTLNQLLVELDGFEQNNGIVVICATNFAESLDKALTRPGRLDRQVVVPIPDIKGRLEILEMYASKLVLEKSVELQTMARRTAGMTGADLFNILNIAAVRSSAEDLAAVPMRYLEEAFDRVVVGLERRNPMSDQEKKLTAYHEGGHTLISIGNKGADPVHKATIMPRGNALGITWSVPEKEKYSDSFLELQARLDVLMGGKAAEELTFGPRNVTAGCTSDLRQATSLARRMVMNFGMSQESGPAPIYFEVNDYAVLSDEAKHEIDMRTQTLLTDAYQRAMEHLKTHEKELQFLAEALIEYETLSAEEIHLAIQGKTKQISIARKDEEAREKLPYTARDVTTTTKRRENRERGSTVKEPRGQQPSPPAADAQGTSGEAH